MVDQLNYANALRNLAGDPSNGATMQAYQPSWRDQLGAFLADHTSGSPGAQRFVQGLVGSSGLGNTGPSVADFVPGVGQVLGAQEAAHQGDYRGAAMAMVPIPGSAEIAPEARAVERLYHRRTRGDVFNPDVGFGMFANSPDRIEGYGANHYVLDAAKVPPRQIVDAQDPQFRNALFRSLITKRDDVKPMVGKSGETALEWKQTAKNILEEAAPSDIVNSAGLWDNLDLMQHTWDNVLEPNGWTLVKTPDGAISFDPSHSVLIEKDGRRLSLTPVDHDPFVE